LKKKLLLAQDKNGNIARQRAAFYASLQALETLWRWAKEEEINIEELWLGQPGDALTAFQILFIQYSV